ncbi:MFS transporter [Rhodobacteraceae bacterium 2CG4]|uniref:MFS transporter n=1 Tax=Halovulum marinum TaxID=2662447 RepID=A0A6L5Z0N5_9RHOB|nr:MFS transporter [Halovulum marinum]MSU89635.1 MFS transporter [Halovulum marinum]
MRALGDFLRTNAPWLTAGGLLTFGSAFGQTYFIAVFAGEIRAEFDLSHGEWGSIYALGTLASAALMLLVGGVVDGYRTRSLAVLNLVLFAAVCAAMALNPAAGLLVVIVFGLRFCGQGMMSHLAIVSVGRWFAAQRGRAISIVSMGFSLAEAVMPVSFVLLTGWLGWRGAWGVAALVLLAYVPVVLLLLRRERSPRGAAQGDGGTGMLGRHWTRRGALRHWLFWVSLPGLLAQPIFGTAFFFQQVHLVERKGWTLEAFTGLFPLYTGAGLAALLATGAAIDRWGAGRVMPFYLLPLAAAFTLISVAESLALAALGMVLMGLMHGMGAAASGAFWPEYYGTRHLGAIRSVATATMVFATALGPLVTGWLIDLGVDYDRQLQGMALIVLAAAALLAAGLRRARPLLAAAQPLPL